ncbi:unnamed protein product [Sphenostylis stenocarpa]|uniref:Amino acid transporter transmembrane domain-containing protein n=1 Tax=Sphenostylis stenocarpa TaxID=92480 RepID=A0AA86TKA4_9FABA|nr:unnamed protein product [Sphenostylis stenocarpa]
MKIPSPSNITEALEPLLSPDCEQSAEDRSAPNGSISGAVFNISTTMIGAGIMSVPATMKVLGIIPGFLVIVLVALITDVTVEFMLRYTISGKSTTYAGMMGESFGSVGSLAVKICVLITNFGILIIYLIILGNFLILLFEFLSMHIIVINFFFGTLR